MSDPASYEPPTPDDKDWTWVLEERCLECGFEAQAVDVSQTGEAVRANARAWQQVLAGDGVRVRPESQTWSPLEYACHVRDVFALFDQRLHRMLDEDDPLFANWDQDETAIAERYHEQDPKAVSNELMVTAERIADSFDALTSEQWTRPGRRSDGASFTVDSFARYFLHDPLHHLWDVEPA